MQSTPLHLTSSTPIFISSSILRLGLRSGLSSGFSPKIWYAFLITSKYSVRDMSYVINSNTVGPRFPEIRITKYRSSNFYNEVHALRLARHPNANSLIRNLRNKVEHVLTKTHIQDAVEPRELHESVHLTLYFGVRLVKYFTVFL
jgi:hypothetical protein